MLLKQNSDFIKTIEGAIEFLQSRFGVPKEYKPQTLKNLIERIEPVNINQVFSSLDQFKQVNISNTDSTQKALVKIINISSIKNINLDDINSLLDTFLVPKHAAALKQVLQLSKDLPKGNDEKIAAHLAYIFSIASNDNSLKPEDNSLKPEDNSLKPEHYAMIGFHALAMISNVPKPQDGTIDTQALIRAIVGLLPKTEEKAKEALTTLNFLIEHGSYNINGREYLGLAGIIGDETLATTSIDEVKILGSFIESFNTSLDELNKTLNQKKPVSENHIKSIFDAIKELNKIEKLDEKIKQCDGLVRPAAVLPYSSWLDNMRRSYPLIKHTKELTDDHYKKIAKFVNLTQKEPADSTTTMLECIKLCKELSQKLFENDSALQGLFKILFSDLNSSEAIKEKVGLINGVLCSMPNRYKTLSAFLEDVTADNIEHLINAWKSWCALGNCKNEEDKNRLYSQVFTNIRALPSRKAEHMMDTLSSLVPALEKDSYLRNALDTALNVNQTWPELESIYHSTKCISQVKNNDLFREIQELFAACRKLKKHDLNTIHNGLDTMFSQTPFEDFAGDLKRFDTGILSHVHEISDACINKMCDVFISANKCDDKDTVVMSLQAGHMLKLLPTEILEQPEAFKSMLKLMASPFNNSKAIQENAGGISWVIGLFGDNNGHEVFLNKIKEIDHPETFEKIQKAWETYQQKDKTFTYQQKDKTFSDVRNELASADINDVITLTESSAILFPAMSKFTSAALIALILNKISTTPIEESRNVIDELNGLSGRLKEIDPKVQGWTDLVDVINTLDQNSIKDISNLIQEAQTNPRSKLKEIDIAARVLEASCKYGNSDGLKDFIRAITNICGAYDQDLFGMGSKVQQLGEKGVNLLNSPEEIQKQMLLLTPAPPSFFEIFKTVFRQFLPLVLHDRYFSPFLYASYGISGTFIASSLLHALVASTALTTLFTTSYYLLMGTFLLSLVLLTYAVGVNAYRAYKIERSYNLLQLYIEKHIIGYRGEQPLRERISEFENKVNADKKKIRRVFFF